MKKYIALILGAFLLFSSGFLIRDCSAQRQLSKVSLEVEHSYEQIEFEKNRVVSLEKAITGYIKDNEELRAVVSELRDRPPEIKYVVQTETVLQPGEPVLVTPDLPQEYLFTLADGIAVARFAQEDSEFRFETYDLSFKTSLALGKKTSAALLQIKSSHNPEVWHEVPTQLEVVRIDERKFFEPHIGIGITGSLPAPDLTASLYVSLLHPRDDIDILQPRISLNGSQIRLGLDPVSYNLGDRLPIVTDTWIAPGVSYGSNGLWSADLTIGTKF